MQLHLRLAAVIMLAALASCKNPASDQPGETPDNGPAMPKALGYQIVAQYPHDTGAYTQGLVWHNGNLIEGTGQWGESNVRRVDLQTGKVLTEVKNDTTIFGEGITVLGDSLYQLTWQNRKGYIYEAKTLKRIGEFPLQTEGWGITNNGRELIYSDGSSNLYFLDPKTLREIKRIGVRDNYGPVGNLNELEYINGFIYANRYQFDYILKIDPESGQVVGRVDLSDLKGRTGIVLRQPADQVLNGIAYDPETGRIFITGKYWPLLFEVRFDD